MRLLKLVIAAALLGLGAHAPAARASGLTLGFSADPALTSEDPSAATVWIPHAVAAGASIVRVNLIWSKVAPVVRPESFIEATHPAPVTTGPGSTGRCEV